MEDEIGIFKMEILGKWEPAESEELMKVELLPPRGRGTGRPHAMVAWAKLSPNNIIIVPTDHDRKAMIDSGVPYEQVLTTYMAQDKGFLRELSKDVEFWIDEAHDVIQSRFKRRVAGISVVGNPQEASGRLFRWKEPSCTTGT